MPKVKKSTAKRVKKSTTKKTAKKKPLIKKAEKKEVKKEKKIKAKKTVKRTRYWEGVGRRKAAVARVRIFTRGGKGFFVNEEKLEDYFSISFLDQIAISPLEKLKLLAKFKISAIVKGGGISAQAEAIRHGLSRALLTFNPNFRKKLKKAGFLTRDSRRKERKKFGLKRARRAPQWQKR